MGYTVVKDKEMGGSNYEVFREGVKVGEIFKSPEYLGGMPWMAVNNEMETMWTFATLRDAKDAVNEYGDRLFEIA